MSDPTQKTESIEDAVTRIVHPGAAAVRRAADVVPVLERRSA